MYLTGEETKYNIIISFCICHANMKYKLIFYASYFKEKWEKGIKKRDNLKLCMYTLANDYHGGKFKQKIFSALLSRSLPSLYHS